MIINTIVTEETLRVREHILTLTSVIPVTLEVSDINSIITIRSEIGDIVTGLNHSAMFNLTNDDHPQYLTTSRAELLYAPLDHASNTNNPHNVTASQIEYVPGISVYDKIAALDEEPNTLSYIISGGYF